MLLVNDTSPDKQIALFFVTWKRACGLSFQPLLILYPLWKAFYHLSYFIVRWESADSCRFIFGG